MSPATEIRLVALRELRRSVRSAKGIVLGVLTLLGALVSALVSVQIEGSNRANLDAASTEAFVAAKRHFYEQLTGDASLAAYIATVPYSLLLFLKITVWFLPLLVALLGFDCVAGELVHRSVRYWAIRTRRASYFIGKLLGLWALIGLITFVLNVLADGAAIARGYVTVGQAAAWGLRFWAVAVVIASAWTAIATFISACFRTPILALLSTFATFFVMWLFGLGGFLSRVQATEAAGAGAGAGASAIAKSMSWYEYAYPNAYDTLLVSPDASKAVVGACVLLGFTAAIAAAGSALLARRDI